MHPHSTLKKNKKTSQTALSKGQYPIKLFSLTTIRVLSRRYVQNFLRKQVEKKETDTGQNSNKKSSKIN